MEKQMVKIPIEEYEELQRYKHVDKEILIDIAMGIKDILAGNIEEI